MRSIAISPTGACLKESVSNAQISMKPAPSRAPRCLGALRWARRASNVPPVVPFEARRLEPRVISELRYWAPDQPWSLPRADRTGRTITVFWQLVAGCSGGSRNVNPPQRLRASRANLAGLIVRQQAKVAQTWILATGLLASLCPVGCERNGKVAMRASTWNLDEGFDRVRWGDDTQTVRALYPRAGEAKNALGEIL